MEKTFEQCKDEVAEKLKYSNWSQLEYACYRTEDYKSIEECYQEAAELYATSKAAKAWEDACELQRQMCSDQFLNAVDSKVRQTAAKEYCETAPKPTNPYK